ncbi:hypothetical protein MT997_28425 [Paenibacillus sp. OVF10]|nr:hypothetical protein MT997_28425 [Paenibacillus sp. OVF10]
MPNDTANNVREEKENELRNLNREEDELFFEIHGDPYDYDDYSHYEDEIKKPEFRLEVVQSKIRDVEAELRAMDLEKENEVKRNYFAGFVPSSSAIVSDSESDNDLLSREPQAIIISQMIANKHTSSPITVGISGQWGLVKAHF